MSETVKCPKGKAVFEATSRTGQSALRTSPRPYSHAVEVTQPSDAGAWGIRSFHESIQGAVRAGQSYLSQSARLDDGTLQYSVVPLKVLADRREAR